MAALSAYRAGRRQNHATRPPRNGNGCCVNDQGWCCFTGFFLMYLESFRALLPASWADLALVSGSVLIF
eukprot:scaffold61710_cov55-Phaeocystis_antarctica.AAC.2